MQAVVMPEPNETRIIVIKIPKIVKDDKYCEDTIQYEYLDKKLHNQLSKKFCNVSSDCASIRPTAHCFKTMNRAYLNDIQAISHELANLSCIYKSSYLTHYCAPNDTKDTIECMNHQCVAYNQNFPIPPPSKLTLPHVEFEMPNK